MNHSSSVEYAMLSRNGAHFERLDSKSDSLLLGVNKTHDLWELEIKKKQYLLGGKFRVSTYFEPLLFDSIGVVDYFIVILHIRDPVAAFFQLTGCNSLNEVHFVGGFHQGWVKLGGDAGESLCEWQQNFKTQD